MHKHISCIASEVVVDDLVKIGDRDILYRITEIEPMKHDDQEFVMMRLGITGTDQEPTVGGLVLRPQAPLKVYRQ